MYAHLGVLLVNILAISRHESVARMVEDIQEPIVERQSSTKDGSKHNLIRGHLHARNTQGRGDVTCFIVQSLADFIGFQFANALDVVTKKQPVLLVIHIPNFG